MPQAMMDGRELEAMAEGPLTRAEVDAWAAQCGERCPTKEGAIAFAVTNMKLERVLKPADLKLLKSSVHSDKNPHELATMLREAMAAEGRTERPGDVARALMHARAERARLEAKALNCTDAKASRIAQKARTKEIKKSLQNLRVRVNATGGTGRATWRYCRNGDVGADTFLVELDGGGSAEVKRNEVTILCAAEGCDAAATKKCTQCKQRWYCGRDCQVKDWRGGHAAACKQLRAKLDAAARVRVDLNENPLQGAAVMPAMHL